MLERHLTMVSLRASIGSSRAISARRFPSSPSLLNPAPGSQLGIYLTGMDCSKLQRGIVIGTTYEKESDLPGKLPVSRLL